MLQSLFFFEKLWDSFTDNLELLRPVNNKRIVVRSISLYTSMRFKVFCIRSDGWHTVTTSQASWIILDKFQNSKPIYHRLRPFLRLWNISVSKISKYIKYYKHNRNEKHINTCSATRPAIAGSDLCSLISALIIGWFKLIWRVGFKKARCSISFTCPTRRKCRAAPISAPIVIIHGCSLAVLELCNVGIKIPLHQRRKFPSLKT